MPKLNIFKLFPLQKNALTELLAAHNIRYIAETTIEANGTIYQLSLYFSEEPVWKEVKWITQLQKLFPVSKKRYQNYSAVVLIEGPDYLYAVSYGMAHFFVARFADWDFGINIAERLLIKYSVKNAREFGGMASKSITTYNNASEIPIEPGESVNYIKGESVDKSKWGKSICCGQSISLRARHLSIDNSHLLVSELETTLYFSRHLNELSCLVPRR